MACLVTVIATSVCQAQPVDVGLDFQTNAIVQLERAFDGTIWGISSSSVDRMPTLAGVFAIMSTDCGGTWGSTQITDNMWRWGVDICPISYKVVWAVVNREDTNELYSTTDGGRMWRMIESKEVQLDRIMSVHFFSPTIGVVIGQAGRRIENRWYASRTTDGGATWQRSAPMIVDPVSEHIGERNDKSMTSFSGVCWIGMSSGRIMITQDTGRTWRMERTSMAGGISGIAVLTTGSLAVFGKDKSNATYALNTTDGKNWTPLTLPNDVGVVRGVRSLRNGTLVTTPDPRVGSRCYVLGVADAETSSGTVGSLSAVAGPTVDRECYSVLQCENGKWIFGAELLPGSGIVWLDSR